jgi:hypothetical protein
MSLLKRVKAWQTGQAKSGATGLALVLDTVELMVSSEKDWGPIATFIGLSDTQAGAMARMIVGQCVGGVSISKATVKNPHPSGYRFKLGENFGATDKLDTLRQLVEDGVSIRSADAIKTAFEIQSQPATWDHDRYVKIVAKKIIDNNEGADTFLADVKAAVAAMKAVA